MACCPKKFKKCEKKTSTAFDQKIAIDYLLTHPNKLMAPDSVSPELVETCHSEGKFAHAVVQIFNTMASKTTLKHAR